MIAAPKLVDSDEWQQAVLGQTELTVWMWLLDDDIRSAQIFLAAYRDSIANLSRLTNSVDKTAPARCFHNAKGFVCAVRRIARLLEGMVSTSGGFPPAVADAVKLEWRKKRALLQEYVEPRNAIEHIDGEIRGNTVFILMNLVNNVLAVTPDKSARISDSTLDAIIGARNKIVGVLLAM